jgi:hypothetical protein
MSDIAMLAVWSLVVGLVAGVALHASIPVERRTGVTRWCLAVGAFAIGSVGVAISMGVDVATRSTALGLGFAGAPALVAGVVMLALARLKKEAPSRSGDRPDV